MHGIFQDYNNLHQGMLSIYLSQIHRNSKVHVTGSLVAQETLYIFKI